ncbi:MAG: DbpA RNA binding domain-containing protein, partial [Erythrobacter sp.]
HVEIPRDAETLQHRSGRTGRAGRKGIAVLIVPFPARRRVEAMLHRARIAAEWQDVPDREAIAMRDRERLLGKLLAPTDFDEADRELARQLLAQRSPEDIAALLVHAHRARLPEPEDIVANSREAQKERHRPGFEDTVWFRMDLGRSEGADPRWLLPLICRRGHITRNEIGAIRIGQAETYFQIPRAIADKYASANARTAEGEEDAVHIERSDAGPREAARTNRQRRPPRSSADNAFVKAKAPGRKFVKNAGGAPRSAQPGSGPAPKPGKPAHAKKPGHKRKFKHS